MGHSNTTNLGLIKPEHRDPDTYESWEQPVNSNMDLLDAAIGSRIYTEKKFVADGEPLSTSIDKLDAACKILDGLRITQDQWNALQVLAATTANFYVTKNYARILQKITLVPEYVNTVFHPSGANNLGAMTHGYEEDGTYRWQYYKWLSTEATLQSYDIAVQVRIPATFVVWSTNALRIDICTQSNDAADCTVDATIAEDGTIGTTSSITGIVSTVGGTWYGDRASNSLITFPSSDAVISSLVGGELLNILIRCYSKSSNYVKIGNITLYLQC